MECLICLDKQANVRTRCGHPFCAACLTTWYQINPTCPLCRTPLFHLTSFFSATRIQGLKGKRRYLRRNKLVIATQYLFINSKRYHFKEVAAIEKIVNTVKILVKKKGTLQKIIFEHKNAELILQKISNWFHVAAAWAAENRISEASLE